jgi:hypothetical protein
MNDHSSTITAVEEEQRVTGKKAVHYSIQRGIAKD